MPNGKFKSITVPDYIYDNYQETFNKIKKELRSQGINSLTGYFTHQINQIITEDEIHSKYERKIQLQSIDENRVILLDNRINRVVEVQFKKSFDNSLICLLCDSTKCAHIGFCYSIHKIYERLSQ